MARRTEDDFRMVRLQIVDEITGEPLEYVNVRTNAKSVTLSDGSFLEDVLKTFKTNLGNVMVSDARANAALQEHLTSNMHADASRLQDAFIGLSVDPKTGVVTFLRYDGQTLEWDTPMEHIPLDISLDKVTGDLVLKTDKNPEGVKVNLSKFIDVFEGDKTDSTTTRVTPDNHILVQINKKGVEFSHLSQELQEFKLYIDNFLDLYEDKIKGIEEGANNYTLPAATSDTLGGIIPGFGLETDADGITKATNVMMGDAMSTATPCGLFLQVCGEGGPSTDPIPELETGKSYITSEGDIVEYNDGSGLYTYINTSTDGSVENNLTAVQVRSKFMNGLELLDLSDITWYVVPEDPGIEVGVLPSGDGFIYDLNSGERLFKGYIDTKEFIKQFNAGKLEEGRADASATSFEGVGVDYITTNGNVIIQDGTSSDDGQCLYTWWEFTGYDGSTPVTSEVGLTESGVKGILSPGESVTRIDKFLWYMQIVGNVTTAYAIRSGNTGFRFKLDHDGSIIGLVERVNATMFSSLAGTLIHATKSNLNSKLIITPVHSIGNTSYITTRGNGIIAGVVNESEGNTTYQYKWYGWEKLIGNNAITPSEPLTNTQVLPYLKRDEKLINIASVRWYRYVNGNSCNLYAVATVGEDIYGFKYTATSDGVGISGLVGVVGSEECQNLISGKKIVPVDVTIESCNISFADMVEDNNSYLTSTGDILSCAGTREVSNEDGTTRQAMYYTYWYMSEYDGSGSVRNIHTEKSELPSTGWLVNLASLVWYETNDTGSHTVIGVRPDGVGYRYAINESNYNSLCGLIGIIEKDDMAAMLANGLTRCKVNVYQYDNIAGINPGGVSTLYAHFVVVVNNASYITSMANLVVADAPDITHLPGGGTTEIPNYKWYEWKSYDGTNQIIGTRGMKKNDIIGKLGADEVLIPIANFTWYACDYDGEVVAYAYNAENGYGYAYALNDNGYIVGFVGSVTNTIYQQMSIHGALTEVSLFYGSEVEPQLICHSVTDATSYMTSKGDIVEYVESEDAYLYIDAATGNVESSVTKADFVSRLTPLTTLTEIDRVTWGYSINSVDPETSKETYNAYAQFPNGAIFEYSTNVLTENETVVIRKLIQKLTEKPSNVFDGSVYLGEGQMALREA